MKKPVAGQVAVRKLNLDGDEQADLSVHGGVEKAVYAYPSEHYAYWRSMFPGMKMPWGTFGENFTTEGVLEDEVHVGDRLGVGTAAFEVTKPRFPCFKLGIRFGTQAMVKLFLESGRTGFYLKVLQEGSVRTGDSIGRTWSDPSSPTIASVVRARRNAE
jgi:MOSC domain-containing protein YiiM